VRRHTHSLWALGMRYYTREGGMALRLQTKVPFAVVA
jgi:hypothetical protein